MRKKDGNDSVLTGFLFAGAAFISWGVLPAFWKLLDHIAPLEILANRIVWSFLFVVILALITGRYSEIRAIIKNKKAFATVALGSLFVTVNWLIYIIAVNGGHIVDASLGYYINPLLSFFLGTVILKEKSDLLKKTAFVFAAAGVLSYAAGMGRIPWISLALAGSFGTYGLIKKITGAGALASLAVETALMVPLSVAYMIFCAFTGTREMEIVLPLSGIVTALPLFFFALAANRIQLSSVGFMQFLAPSINLVMGVFLYGEMFTSRHLTSFSLIWAGLIIYLSSQLISVTKVREGQ